MILMLTLTKYMLARNSIQVVYFGSAQFIKWVIILKGKLPNLTHIWDFFNFSFQSF